jgi:hypothetical protein
VAEDAHAKLSPSSSDRWIKCPGSVAAQAAVTTPDVGNKASKEGTVAHSVLELCVLFGFDPQEWLGKFLIPDYPAVTQQMIDSVQVALDWIEEYVDTYGRKNLIIVPEHRVYIGSMIGVPDEICNGTSDLQIVHRDMSAMVTLDYKNGVMPVHAENNSQLMLYTAGGIKEHGKFKRYKNVIVQPRAAKKRAVDETEYTGSKLKPFLEKAGRAAQAALLPNAPRVAGDHCTFCKAASNCNTLRQRAHQIAADEFGEIEDPEILSPERVNEVLNEVEVLQTFINAVRARALSILKDGGELPDYELGWGPRKRVFQNVEEVVEWCRKKKLPPDEYMPRQLLTPKRLEAALRRNGLYPKKKRGEDRVESPIAHLVGYTTPSPALKPKRGANAENDFDEFEDD